MSFLTPDQDKALTRVVHIFAALAVVGVVALFAGGATAVYFLVRMLGGSP